MSIPFKKPGRVSLKNPLVDYLRILYAFISTEDGGWNKNLNSTIDKIPINNSKITFNRAMKIRNSVYKMKNTEELLDLLFSYNTSVYKKPLDSTIINLGNPYII